MNRLRFVDGLDGDVAQRGGLANLDRGDIANQSSRLGDRIGEARELTCAMLDTHTQDSVDDVFAHETRICRKRQQMPIAYVTRLRGLRHMEGTMLRDTRISRADSG